MMKTLKKLWICLALLAVMGVGVSACHTLQGAGEDLEEAGEAMDDAMH